MACVPSDHFVRCSFHVSGANRGLGLELCRQLTAGDVYSSIYAICRKSTSDLTALAKSANSKIQVLEDVEITKDECVKVVQELFATNGRDPIPIHLLIHNAGAYGPPEDVSGPTSEDVSQTLENVTMERMRFALELNTLAPLRLTKALLPNLVAGSSANDPGKIAIITSAMGSMEENGSGGHYGYRASKAAVNMVGKSLAVDLKDKNVAVCLGTYGVFCVCIRDMLTH